MARTASGREYSKSGIGGRTQEMSSMIHKVETGTEISHPGKNTAVSHEWCPVMRAIKRAYWRLKGMGQAQKRKSLAKALESYNEGQQPQPGCLGKACKALDICYSTKHML